MSLLDIGRSDLHVYAESAASTQDAYEKAVVALFHALDRTEENLKQSSRPYYFGDRLTEADVRLYTTIARFDVSQLPTESQLLCEGRDQFLILIV